MVAITVINPNNFSINEIIENKIFVYGKKVNDLLNVVNDAVSMLNVSVTQELYKKIQVLEVENEILKAESKNQKSTYEDSFAALELKMEELLKSTSQVSVEKN